MKLLFQTLRSLLNRTEPLEGGWRSRWVARNMLELERADFLVRVYVEKVPGSRRSKLDMSDLSIWDAPKDRMLSDSDKNLIIQLVREEVRRWGHELEVE